MASTDDEGTTAAQVRDFIERMTAELIAQGCPADEARRCARRNAAYIDVIAADVDAPVRPRAARKGRG